mgnify:CR=1 FL=1
MRDPHQMIVDDIRVALLGWCPSGNQEIFSLEELVKEFDYHHMSKSPAVFDIVKLKWMNAVNIIFKCSRPLCGHIESDDIRLPRRQVRLHLFFMWAI